MLWFLLRDDKPHAMGLTGWITASHLHRLAWGATQPSRGLRTLQALENNKKVVFRHLKNEVFRYSGHTTRNSSMFKVQILFNIK